MAATSRAAKTIRAQTTAPGMRTKRRVRSGSLPDITPITPTDVDDNENVAKLARENEELRQATLPISTLGLLAD